MASSHPLHFEPLESSSCYCSLCTFSKLLAIYSLPVVGTCARITKLSEGKYEGFQFNMCTALTRFRRTCMIKEVKRVTGGSRAFERRWHLQMQDTPVQVLQASEWRQCLRLYPHPLSPLPQLCKAGKTGNSTNQQAAPGTSPRLSRCIMLRRAAPFLRPSLPYSRPGSLVD